MEPVRPWKKANWTRPAPGTVVALVGCSAQKQDVPCAAENLYTSALFRKARAFADVHADAWFILSGKLGVLAPSSRVVPYDYCLSEMPKEVRERWAVSAADQLCIRLESESIAGDIHLVILCGREYAALVDHLPPSDPRFRFHIHRPLSDLPVGKRLSWLKANSKNDFAGIRLNEEQRGMLDGFAAGLEQDLYQFGAKRRRALGLWKKGLLIAVREHPEKDDWTQFDITDKGRRLTEKIARAASRSEKGGAAPCSA